MAFRYLEHTADIGIAARGESKEQVIEEICLAFTNLIYDSEKVKSQEFRELIIDSRTNAGKIVDLLSKILYLIDGEDFLIKEVKVKNFKPLVVIVGGELMNPLQHKMKSMVKAVTHYKAYFRKKGSTYLARVYLDI
ncbi:MAG: Protein archease [candidate division WS2 bacterium]|uniref:Protein archease n=1 Tax=Psychracetigena formicireducens TaxID=2986056 RepID=A0A9E2BIN0_PSYF1|nr:Protein archease [Candidatus Psychracetigena formicireducens]MBT9144835.1 Protein archease [Candidatus Psychracetigena formicireducens]MBT9150649.1 Protein archease [Candidatus Psychracetigena formicireducens]